MPEATIWEADVDGACVSAHDGKLKRLGINALVGNQEDPTVLKQWVATSGGHFDAVIDDGAHTNSAIMDTFKML
jgi:hypothetical protein